MHRGAFADQAHDLGVDEDVVDEAEEMFGSLASGGGGGGGPSSPPPPPAAAAKAPRRRGPAAARKTLNI
jgi:hypothetical protein